MSRRKKTKPAAPEREKKSAGLWSIIAAMGIAALILVGVYLRPENPEQLYREARETFDSDPSRALLLSEAAVSASGEDYPEAQLLFCRALGREGLWQEALGCFASIKDTSRCDAQELIALADEAGRARQTTLHKLALEAANRPGPSQTAALQRLVQLGLDHLDHEAVLRWCETWRQADPQSLAPLQAALTVYLRQANFHEAAEICRQALALSPPPSVEGQLRSTLAILLVDLGEAGPARQEFDALRREGPLNRELQLKHAELLRLERQPQAALEELDRLLLTDRKNVQALLARGIILFDLEEFERSQADLEEVVELAPLHKEAHYKLGQALLRLGEKDKAQEHLDISRKLTDEAIRSLGAGGSGENESPD